MTARPTRRQRDRHLRSEAALRPAERTPVMVFVSYSRRDFHFAEAATATLKQNEILDPGKFFVRSFLGYWPIIRGRPLRYGARQQTRLWRK